MTSAANLFQAVLVAGWVAAGFAAPAVAQDNSKSDLAAAAQNPIANMISLPLQNNTFFGPDWALRFQIQFLFPK